jgi:predicted kinase
MGTSRYRPRNFHFAKPFSAGKYSYVIISPSYDIWGCPEGGEPFFLDRYFKNVLKKSDKVIGECEEGIFESTFTADELEKFMSDKGFVYDPRLEKKAQEASQEYRKSYRDTEDITRDEQDMPSQQKKDKTKVYMMIGLPASGKSTLAKHLFPDYQIVSKDLCNGSEAKERSKLEGLLAKGEKDIVVDDTNYNQEARAKIISLAKKYNAEVLGVYLKVDKTACLQRNKTRINKVPDVAIHSLAKKFEEPNEAEGFESIIRISI